VKLPDWSRSLRSGRCVGGCYGPATMETFDIIRGTSGFRARLLPNEEPIAPWRPTKIQACHDIVNRSGPGVYVIDRTDTEPRAGSDLFDTLA